MDANIQIESLKSQIENMKLQIDNIEMQSNNNMFMMNNASIVEQILNLSIQMFNAGIHAFNTGKNIPTMINIQKFYDQLRNVSEQINLIINANNMQQMQPINILQQPIRCKNITFENATSPNGKFKTNIVAKFGKTVNEVLDQYMLSVYGTVNKKLIFLYNSKQINRDEKRVIEDFFKSANNNLQVIEIS